MTLPFGLSPLSLTLLSLSLLSAVCVLAVYCPRILRVARRSRQCSLTLDRLPSTETRWPGASVIIYARGEADRLEAMLPVILSQDYGGLMEVIVVNDGDSSDVRGVIDDLQLTHRNLYLTFTPDGAHNLSRKKLGITLGIKAARYDVVVMTTTDAVVTSSLWLTKIMRHFTRPATGIVLGYAAPVPDCRVPAASLFSFLSDSIAWLAPAIARRAYRGTELNLAYRRDLFFNNKGFSRSFNLHFGDDDIFVSEIATRSNTVVELSPESIVNFGSYDMKHTLRDMAVRYAFTRHFVKRHPRPWLQTGECAFCIQFTAGAAAIAINPSDIFTTVLISTVFLLTTGCIAWVWGKTSTALSGRRLFLVSPLLSLLHPLRRAYLWLYSRLSKQRRYTWQ